MSTAAGSSWGRVEFYTSYALMLVLASVIGTRLAFASVWTLPTPDLILSTLALILVLASFWIARHQRSRRIAIIVFASATQLLPMLIRHPALLLPVIGALIPVIILLVALVSLSRKDRNNPRLGGS